MKKYTCYKTVSIVLCTAVMFLFCSCSGNEETAAETKAAAFANEAAYFADGSDTGDTEELAKYSLSGGTGAAEETGNTYTGTAEAGTVERKLIRNVNLSMETVSFNSVNERLKQLVEQYGGYIENYSEYCGNYNYPSQKSSDFTVRIPAENTDAFLADGVQGVHVISMSENTQDVTLKYTDLETKLSTLTAERDRLLELLQKAQDIESIIALEERLTEVRYELESIQSSLKNYDNQVQYSTVWISLIEVKTEEVPEEASFLERVKAGFTASTAGLLESLEDLAVWFLSNILGILLFVLLLFLLIKLVRGLSAGSGKISMKKKEQETKAEKQDETPETPGAGEQK